MNHRSAKGTSVPFFLPLCSPLQRDNALLTSALAALQEGRFADALVATEYVCRRHPDSAVPAILRARILQSCRPELAEKAWYRAWHCDPLNPTLQDALLRAWLSSGAMASVVELGPAFLPERCRHGNQAPLLALLREAGVERAGACWKSGTDIEGIVYQLSSGMLEASPGDAPSDTITLIVSCETSQSFHDIVSGTRFRIPCPDTRSTWSLAFSDRTAEPSGLRVLQGSPLVFRSIYTPMPPATQPGPIVPRARRKKAIAPVDIIIPVYRDHQLVKACIDSVLASLPANRVAAELIVIDDASPEPALSTWLAQLAREGRITLLRNRYNLGFIETVNRGLSYHADRDALLLNADTVVHGDWLDRLHAALYRADDIASVSPWSNNGEITNFPRVADAAPAPTFSESAQIDAMAARLHADGVVEDVELPACCGFAMLMRRSVLNRIGHLDGGALVRGYGEEVDWCLRARAAGYRHVAATGVFVAHTGTVSFRFEKRLRVKQNREVIADRYPAYYPEYRAFLRRDPLAGARRALQSECMATVGTWMTTATKNGKAAVQSVMRSAAVATTVARIAVWQHRSTDVHAAQVLKLARLIATRRLPLRLLVIGDASEALWHTGVVDAVPFNHDSDAQVITDAALVSLSGCDCILAAAHRDIPAGIAADVMDGNFRAAVWLANWQKTDIERHRQARPEAAATVSNGRPSTLPEPETA